MAVLETVVANAQKKAKDKASNQISLFTMIPQVESVQKGIGFDCPEAGIVEMEQSEKLRFEKEALGFFLTSHPLLPYHKEMQRLCLTTLEDIGDSRYGGKVSCGVLITSLKEIQTKKGDKMAFAGIEDLTANGELVIFSRTYAEFKELLQADQPLVVEASIDASTADTSFDDDADDDEEQAPREIKLIAEKIIPLAKACSQSDTPVCFGIPKHRLNEEGMLSLKALLQKHRGTVNAEAYVFVDGHQCFMHLGHEYTVQPGAEFDTALELWASSDNMI